MNNREAVSYGAPLGLDERGRTMTIQKFLTLTAATPVPVLRRATALALSVERPSSREAYTRFYCRVIRELGVAEGTECEPVSNRATAVAA